MASHRTAAGSFNCGSHTAEWPLNLTSWPLTDHCCCSSNDWQTIIRATLAVIPLIPVELGKVDIRLSNRVILLNPITSNNRMNIRLCAWTLLLQIWNNEYRIILYIARQSFSNRQICWNLREFREATLVNSFVSSKLRRLRYSCTVRMFWATLRRPTGWPKKWHSFLVRLNFIKY